MCPKKKKPCKIKVFEKLKKTVIETKYVSYETKMKENKKENSKKGSLGEEITSKYLEKKGFFVVTRNYRKRWGEIDIVCIKDKILHIVEVNSVTCEIKDGNVSYEKCIFGPENNMHSDKKMRLSRIIDTYLEEKRWEGDWQVDLALVYMDISKKKAKIDVIENIEL